MSGRDGCRKELKRRPPFRTLLFVASVSHCRVNVPSTRNDERGRAFRILRQARGKGWVVSAFVNSVILAHPAMNQASRIRKDGRWMWEELVLGSSKT